MKILLLYIIFIDNRLIVYKKYNIFYYKIYLSRLLNS